MYEYTVYTEPTTHVGVCANFRVANKYDDIVKSKRSWWRLSVLIEKKHAAYRNMLRSTFTNIHSMSES